MKRKTKTRRLPDRIYLKNWLSYKPYKSDTEVDHYFLNLCNELYKEIKSCPIYDNLTELLPPAEIKTMVIILVSYFEDLISETKIWETFSKKHQDLYGTPYPFYETNDHVQGELNLQDFEFLIWYSINILQKEAHVHFESKLIEYLGTLAYNLIYDEWETAPENERLKAYYHLDADEKDYFKIRELLTTIFFDTYLFIPDTRLRLHAALEETFETINDRQNADIILQGETDNLLHSMNSSLLSLKAKEWLALSVGKDHPLYDSILALSEKITGYFFIRGNDEQYFFLEHLATGKKFKLVRKSSKIKDPEDENAICVTSIIKWQGYWWQSGPCIQMGFHADTVLNERNSQQSRIAVSFLDYDPKSHRELMSEQEAAFLNLTDGKKFIFLDYDSLNKFPTEFMKYYNASLQLTPEESAAARQRARKEGLLSLNNKKDFFNKEDESGLIFFNPISGLEIILGLNAAFPLDHNPYYDDNDHSNIVMSSNALLMTPNGSAELVKAWLSKCQKNLGHLSSDKGKSILENLDFLLRFWKKQNYWSRPMINYVGKTVEQEGGWS